MRHLRIEQYNYYMATADGDPETNENTVPDPEAVSIDRSHKNFDAYMETIKEGAVFKSTGPGIEAVRRRKQSRLGVSRTAFITPLGESREDYYEQKLLLTLPWFCASSPVKDADGTAERKFIWQPPPPELLFDVSLPTKELRLTDRPKVLFEHLCQSYEKEICSHSDLICACCEATTSVCKSCCHAVGFHTCENKPDKLRWRKQSLFGGKLDCERCLWNLHRSCLSSRLFRRHASEQQKALPVTSVFFPSSGKRVPTDVIRDKAREFEGNHLLTEEQTKKMITAIEQERNIERVSNSEAQVGEASASSSGDLEEKLRKMLKEREDNMKAGEGVTCQYRVYREIIDSIEKGIPLRMLVQAMSHK